MSELTQTFHRSRLRLWHYALVAALAWTAMIAASLGWSRFEERRDILNNARYGAQISFQKEMLFLFWTDGHGGSAPATNNAPPSPGVARAKERALVNPAPMLRQMQGRSPEPAGYRSRLASLKPLRPENTPDAWEAAALQAFAKGETEVASVVTMDGQEYMRVMRPLVNNASCLQCHGTQDYKVGDIRGGMSVAVPLTPLWATAQNELSALIIIDGVIWVLGLGLIGFGARRAQVHNLERARAETVLHDSEVRYHTLADSGQALIWTSGLDKKYDYFNQPWLAFTGRTLKQELGQGWAEGVHPDDLARCLETYTTAFDRREAFSMVYRLRRHDGEFRWIQDNGAPRFDSQGNFVGYIGHCLDITERKRAEEEAGQLLAEVSESRRMLLSVVEDQQRAEETLRKSENKYRQLVEGAPDIIYSFSNKRGGLYYSSRVESVLGYSVEYLLERPQLWQNLIDPADLERIHLAIQKFISGEPVDIEYRIRDSLGKWHWFHDRSIGKRQAGDEIIIEGIATDITEHKQAETALRDTEARFRLLFEHSPDGIVILDPATGRLLEFNETAHRQLGYSREEFARLSISDLEAAETPEQTRARIASVTREGRSDFETQHRTRQGEIRDIQVTAQLTEIQGHSVYHCVWRDITARKASERVLREQNEILSNSHEGVMIVNLANEVLLWNRGAGEIFGWTQAEALGRPPEQLLGINELGVVSTLRAAVEREGFWNGDMRMQTRDGRKLIVDCRITLVRDEAGRPRARLAFLTDITEKKLLEEKFLHAQRLESIGLLSAGIAHDLNNVLAPIVLAAPLLRASLSAPRDLEILTTLEKSAERGAGLVKQILGFAHSTTGEFRLTQVKHLAWDLISIIEQTFPKSIQLQHQIPTDLWPVQGNATQIHQVLLNLCVNARDAMPSGGTLRLTAANLRLDAAGAGAIPGALPGTWVVLEVADTGAGIPPEMLEHIWESFFTTKGAGKGTGLGLATVRGIVVSHHGFVELHTEVGRGSTFRVFLPAVESEAPRSSSAAPVAILDGHGELILVVDDEAPIRNLVAGILGQHGYRVVSCGDGLEAITLFNAHPDGIALVVTDVDMPRLGGVALARALLQLRPDLRLLAMSGLSRRETDGADVPEIQKLAHAFLRKPFTIENLLGTVHRLLQPPGKT